MAQAQVDLDKTFVRAGVDGRVEQFLVRPGDLVAQIMRPAGVLIPDDAGRNRLQAGFGQIEAQVMKNGMVAEATCISKPWMIIPLVVTDVQDYIAAGAVPGHRAADRCAECGEAGFDPCRPWSRSTRAASRASRRAVSCIVNAYTSNHDVIADPKTGTMKGIALHVVDATGLVHALLLRIQALLLPIKTLVLTGH